MQNSLEIFKAEPKSVFNLLCDGESTGFYMPAYQRPYSWEEPHIRDLFLDCDNVFRNLLESKDAIIFLGSILTVDDRQAKTIYPIERRSTPPKIKLIIDGQQRLSTLIMIILCLNERLRIQLPHVKRAIKNEDNEEIKDSLEGLRELLSQTIIDTSSFTIETQADHPVNKYLPKIIRSQDDQWGKDDKKAIYRSPVAELLIRYQRHVVESDNTSLFKELQLGDFSESSKRVTNNVKEIRKLLTSIENGFEFKTADGTFTDKVALEELVNIETLEQCLGFPFEEPLLKAGNASKKISEIIFLTLFARFLLHRVCLTYVEVNNESYAFDMFEALNTTGEPLTAIETFVPKVIEHLGRLEKEGESESDIEQARNALKSITERFESIIKSKDKNDKAKSLILAFVRAYEGKVKVTSLRNQRDAMLKSYEQCPFVNKNEYLLQLKQATDFLFDHWNASPPEASGLVAKSQLDISNVCLRYLVDINHDIAQPVLLQFFLQDQKYNYVGTEQSSFTQVLKMVTAFSVLWRAMSGGADGIDGVYKRLHERGFEVAGAYSKPYILKSSTLSASDFNLDDLKAYLRQELEAKITSKESPKEGIFEQWLDICSNQPLLTKTKNIKFLILAAFHGMKLEDVGFVRSDTPSTNFLRPSVWDLLSSRSKLKKVFNGNFSSGWSDSSITDPQIFNKIGNVLVDARDNIPTGESWFVIKRAMLDALSNESLLQLNSMLSQSDSISEQALRTASVCLLESKYDEITYAEEWDKKAIEERTKLLLSNAWENLHAWLE